MKVAIVYDRVNKWGGAERVLLALHEIFPNAPLFTSVYSPTNAPWAKVFPKVIPSFLQHIPFAKNHHDKLALLMPIAFESLNLKEFDVIISVTSEAAKGIIAFPYQRHICYCLTPTRYLWSGYDEYFKNKILKKITKPVVSYLQKWDKLAAQRPDEMIAISTEVQSRIKKYYRRKPEIIFPPLMLDTRYKILDNRKQGYFLVVSRLVPYKKVDLVIECFNQLNYPLVIIGTGSEERKLKALADKNIKFYKSVSDRKLGEFYTNAKALIFPQVEDFGLVAVEALAHGTPVIAYKAGGAIDIIIDHKNGIFFKEQSVESLQKAIATFHNLTFSDNIISQSVGRFSFENFQKQICKIVDGS